MSMFQKATKKAVKARVALDGPTGAGKTWTALTWATILGQRIAFIDTERGSASLYADHFTFDVLEMTPPYEPERFVTALKDAEKSGYDVVIVDSMSHAWEGEGGTLDIADAAAQRSGGGNSFTGWKVATPALRHLVDTMLGLDTHLIVTMRSKMEYVLEEDSRGKKVPRKIGMAPVMRNGVEYEFTLVADLDLEHRLTISKSRCDLLADQVYQPGRAAEGAEMFKRWLEAGEPVAARNDVDALVGRMNRLPDDVRGATKARFLELYGRPEHMLASKVEEAQAWIAGMEPTDPPTPPAAAAEPDPAPPAEPAAQDPAPGKPVGEEETASTDSSSQPVDDWDGQALGVRIDELQPEFREIAWAAWKAEFGVVKPTDLPAGHLSRAIDLLNKIEEQQRTTFDARRRRANASMGAVGFKGGDRYDLLREALGLPADAEVSTKQLTLAELTAVEDQCAVLRRNMDEAEAAAAQVAS